MGKKNSEPSGASYSGNDWENDEIFNEEDPEESALLSDDVDDELNFDEIDMEEDTNEEEEAASSHGFIDDSLRLFLSQMGEIPMLTRKQEIALAKKIDSMRTRFRIAALRNGVVRKIVIEALRRVSEGTGRTDKTIDTRKKTKAMKRLPYNMPTLSSQVSKDAEDYQTSISAKKETVREKAWRTLRARGKKEYRLIEELEVRTETLEEIVKRIYSSLDEETFHELPAEEQAHILTLCDMRTPKELFRNLRIVARTHSRFVEERNNMTESNLRLVVSIAKKYRNRGLSFLELIQEGNVGLMKATNKFEHGRGYKFATYATWWIRQAVSRAVADKSRTIRLPVHLAGTLRKIRYEEKMLSHELGRAPKPEEIIERVGIDMETYRIADRANSKISLDNRPEEDKASFADLLEDAHPLDDESPLDSDAIKEAVQKVLMTLPKRERDIIILRYGLDNGYALTLEEVGHVFNLTRERIRQIEAKGTNRVRAIPYRSEQLEKFAN